MLTHKLKYCPPVFVFLYPGHIKTVFGSEMLEYVMNLCQQRIDYLVRLPKSMATHILSFLDWEDIKSMSKTCKRFQQVTFFLFTVGS